MKTRKSFLQKIIITIAVALLCTNFIAPTVSSAVTAQSVGGVLFDPFSDLLCSIGDGVINLLQKCMTGDWGAGFGLSGFLTEDDEYTGWYSGSSGEQIDVEDKEHGFRKGWLGIRDTYNVPTAIYSPEQIFANNVPGLDVNFINPNKYTSSKGSIAADLQPTIAGWYVALRNLAVVGLLSVLVYVGIRILLASTAGDKAKYKQMLTDWVIALCLLFFMHYIMSFALTMVESVTSAIAGNGNETITISVTSGTHAGQSFDTNLLGAARFKTQYKEFGNQLAYTIMYLALVIYTCLFTFFYLRRLLTLAFLTMIAPLVALTYPIDKMGDGKAQAFNMWLKEYMFNLIIQPFHLVIYTVLVGSAMQFASQNIVYMIAALAFILPAEKLLKNFFGINKAGSLGDLVGATALGSYITKGAKALGGGKGGNKGGSSDSGSSDKNKSIRFENKHNLGELAEAEGINPNEETPRGMDLDSEESNNEFNNSENTFDSQNEMDALGKELDNYTNEEIYMDPELQEKQAKYNELYAQQQRAQQEAENKGANEDIDKGSESQRRAEEEQSKDNNEKKELTRKDKARNLWNYHKTNIPGVAKKAFKGAAKLAVGTAFRGAAGGLAGAVAIASGAGLTGGLAAARGGIELGGAVADGTFRAASGIYNAPSRISAWADRQRDIANGDMNNTRQRDRQTRNYMRDEDNIKQLSEHMTKNGWTETDRNGNVIQHEKGFVPTSAQVRANMEGYKEYFDAGLSEMKDILKAEKAEQYGYSRETAALIAGMGKQKGVTEATLNDEKQMKALINNSIKDLRDRGYSKEAATNVTNTYVNGLKVMNGVDNPLQKQAKQVSGKQQTGETKTNPEQKSPRPPRTKK